MGGETRIVFLNDLPSCCRMERIRLPRPDHAVVSVRGELGRSEAWFAGFDEWRLRVGVSWNENDPLLPEVVEQHLAKSASDAGRMLAAHGVTFDDDGYAWVGGATLLVARLGAPGGEMRRAIRNVGGLLDAADEVAGDLERLVAPLVAFGDDDDQWSPEVADIWPDAELTDAVVLLRSARITPVLRGHRLGAWVCAQGIQLFDHAATMVAAEAAPLAWRDAVPDCDPDQDELTPAQSAAWQAEQDRLAKYWHDHLGLIPLAGEPSVLTWHTTYRNDEFEETLRLWG